MLGIITNNGKYTVYRMYQYDWDDPGVCRITGTVMDEVSLEEVKNCIEKELPSSKDGESV